MPRSENQFSVPPEVQPSPERLMAMDGKMQVFINRDAIDPEGWKRVVDGLPPCPRMKPNGWEWDVYDLAGGVRVSTLHPGNWNVPFTYREGGREVEITDVVTHWRDRPKPPE